MADEKYCIGEFYQILNIVHCIYFRFVARSSESQRKKSFGASIANIMTNHYEFHNGLSLAVSNTTLDAMQKDMCSHLIKNMLPKTLCLQMLLDFLCYNLRKTGHNIGVWLESCHRGIGCKPDYIGSHTVDGAGNAGASVRFLELNTSDECTQKIIAD